MSRDTPAIFEASRLRLYALGILGICLVRIYWLISPSSNLVDLQGKPIGNDFITFWSAGHLALEGRPEAAFVRELIFEAQRIAVPGSDSLFLWHYPPTFMLLAALLASVPYLVSYLLFIGGSLVLYAASVRKFLEQPYAILLIVAYPGTFLSITHGQNSMLSTGLLACAFLFWRPRPILAGIFIGLLAFKPQLGLLIPLILIASRQWQVFLSATVTTVLFVGLSIAAFGLDLWGTFFENAALVNDVMGRGLLHWEKMPSAYITLRMLGASEALSYAVHWLIAAAVVGVLLRLWYRCGPTKLSFAALVPAILLILPYVFDYEMTFLAIPIAILATDIAKKGGALWQKIVLIIAFVAPLFLAGIGQNLHVQIGFPVILALFVVAVLRGFTELRLLKTEEL
ncbi:glycosyltransferase family 87 protein [Kiloniella sp.]|uniref:glycosyltransferase family 87 protein n=1 Tax=Kiloniella sp. TaxID=1938587 RepID=UPI003B01F7DE